MTQGADVPSPAAASLSADPDPVSLVIRRRVRPGKEARFEELVGELTALLAQAPGHRGTGVMRPGSAGHHYTLLARFDSAANAQAWEESPQRAAWLVELEGVVEEQLPLEKQPGLEFWFTPPEAPILRQPPRWKMAVVTFLVLFPVAQLVAFLLHPHFGSWPPLLRAALQSAAVVTVMTYIFMPLGTRLAAPWLRR